MVLAKIVSIPTLYVCIHLVKLQTFTDSHWTMVDFFVDNQLPLLDDNGLGDHVDAAVRSCLRLMSLSFEQGGQFHQLFGTKGTAGPPSMESTGAGTRTKKHGESNLPNKRISWQKSVNHLLFLGAESRFEYIFDLKRNVRKIKEN